uniref:Nuclear receptor n=1 Tax=Meloidogyne floridensis TaxID=298350 RepID=A0A915PGL3_9BILA
SCQDCFNNLCGPPCTASCSACKNCQDINFKPQCETPCRGFSGTLVIPPCVDSRSKTQPNKQQIGFNRKIGNSNILSINSKGRVGNNSIILPKAHKDKNEFDSGSESEQPLYYVENDVTILLEALVNICKIYQYKNFEEIYEASKYLMNNMMGSILLTYISKKEINMKIQRQVIQLWFFFAYKLNKPKVGEIDRMNEIKSRMCFWAINVYLVNLYASLDKENIRDIEGVRKMFYESTKIDVKLKTLNENEIKYIKEGVIGVTKYIVKQITKHSDIFVDATGEVVPIPYGYSEIGMGHREDLSFN